MTPSILLDFELRPQMMIAMALDFLLPSWFEIKITLATSLFVILAYWFFAYRSGFFDADRSAVDNSGDAIHAKDKVFECAFVASSP